MEKLTIHPIPLMFGFFKYAKSRMTYLYNLDQHINIYCFVWYIEGAGERVLVDAGATAETVAEIYPEEMITPVQIRIGRLLPRNPTNRISLRAARRCIG